MATLARRLPLRLPMAGAAAVFALVWWSHQAHAGAMHHAALVVQHSSGAVITRCIGFLEDQISGLQLIERSGVEYQAQQFGGLGTAVCQLDYEPQPTPSGCFGSGAYWQYFHRTSGGWTQSSAGASSSSIRDGGMDGWRYAAGANQTPASVSFNTVCPPAAAAAPAAATRKAAAAPAPARPSSSTPPAVAMNSPPPSASATPTLEAMAPTVSMTPKMALADTGPARPTGEGGPPGIWLLMGGSAILLLGLAGINLRRGGS